MFQESKHFISISYIPLTANLGRVINLFIYKLELKILVLLSGIILRTDSRICILEYLEMLKNTHTHIMKVLIRIDTTQISLLKTNQLHNILKSFIFLFCIMEKVTA